MCRLNLKRIRNKYKFSIFQIMIQLLIMTVFLSQVCTNQLLLYNNKPQMDESSPPDSSIDNHCVISVTEHFTQKESAQIQTQK